MTFEELRGRLNQLINDLEAFKKELRAGDYSNKAICARMDLGAVIRELRRSEGFLDRYVADLAKERWVEDKEAGAIG